jgi:ABC-2 type transport system permease protein
MIRAFPTLLRIGFSQAVAYRSEFLVWILSTNMPLVMMVLWTAVAKEAPVGRFGQSEFTAYFLATLLVRLVTSSWVVWEMNFEIRQGAMSMKLLRPINPVTGYLADNLAAVPMRALVSLPIAAVALFVVGGEHLTRDPVQWLVFPLSLAGAFLMTFLVGSAIGALGFFWESSLSVFELWLGLYFVLSGYILPLEFLPPWLHGVVQWLPFRFLLSFPVETVLGLVPRDVTLQALAVQVAYVIAFALLSTLLWRRGVRRYAAYGG